MTLYQNISKKLFIFIHYFQLNWAHNMDTVLLAIYLLSRGLICFISTCLNIIVLHINMLALGMQIEVVHKGLSC